MRRKRKWWWRWEEIEWKKPKDASLVRHARCFIVFLFFYSVLFFWLLFFFRVISPVVMTTHWSPWQPTTRNDNGHRHLCCKLWQCWLVRFVSFRYGVFFSVWKYIFALYYSPPLVSSPIFGVIEKSLSFLFFLGRSPSWWERSRAVDTNRVLTELLFRFGFLQLYELNDDAGRKAFLDDLFDFMQKRGESISSLRTP